MLGTLLLIVLILLLIGAVPTWPYSRDWGYYPSSGLGLVLAVVQADSTGLDAGRGHHGREECVPAEQGGGAGDGSHGSPETHGLHEGTRTDGHDDTPVIRPRSLRSAIRG